MLKNRLPQIIAEINPRVGVAVRQGVEAMELSAKARVHVDQGDLRDAIHIERQGMSFYVVAGNTDVFYGHMEEFGTSHSAPHPFMVPAFEEHRDRTVTAVRTALATL